MPAVTTLVTERWPARWYFAGLLFCSAGKDPEWNSMVTVIHKQRQRWKRHEYTRNVFPATFLALLTTLLMVSAWLFFTGR
jgi:hypothetical protein